MDLSLRISTSGQRGIHSPSQMQLSYKMILRKLKNLQLVGILILKQFNVLLQNYLKMVNGQVSFTRIVPDNFKI